MLRFKNLASGSAGNTTVIQANDGLQRTTALVDCGLSLHQLQKRLARAQLSLETIDAIFITHEHTDHTGCMHALALQHRIPVYMSQGTWVATGKVDYAQLLHFAYDQHALRIGALEIQPFTVPHDAREPLQLCCSDGSRTLGILTDLGHASQHALKMLERCTALLLECNHDESMLAQSKYPLFLRQRIGGDWGHLSNTQAGAILKSLNHTELKHVVGAHLSTQNNTPELVRATLAPALCCAPNEVLLADQETGSAWLEA